jgi:hypothetical protein
MKFLLCLSLGFVLLNFTMPVTAQEKYDLLREINEEAEQSGGIVVMGLISLIPVVIIIRAFIDRRFRYRVLKRLHIK